MALIGTQHGRGFTNRKEENEVFKTWNDAHRNRDITCFPSLLFIIKCIKCFPEQKYYSFWSQDNQNDSTELIPHLLAERNSELNCQRAEPENDTMHLGVCVRPLITALVCLPTGLAAAVFLHLQSAGTR